MKTILLITCLVCLGLTKTNAQTQFVIEPSQSMIMTGKGAGQDATINPYFGQECYAIVKNIGEVEFYIRVQNKKKIIKEITIKKGEVKKVTLLKGYELYLDPNPKGIAKASVAYQKKEKNNSNKTQH